MTHAPLDVIHKPPLAIVRNDRDILACDIARVLQDTAPAHNILVNATTLYPLLTHLDGADGRKGLLKRLIRIEVCRGITLLLSINSLKDADRLAHFLNAVVFRHKHHIGRAPVVFVLMDNLGPSRRIIVPFLDVGLTSDRINHKAILSVGLVLLFGVEIKEHRGIRIVDWLHPDALFFVFVVLVILVSSAQTPCPEATAYPFLESIIKRLIGYAVLLISTI